MKRVHTSGNNPAAIEGENCGLLVDDDDEQEDDGSEVQKEVHLGKKSLEASSTVQYFPSRALSETKIKELEILGAKIDQSKAKVERDVAALKRVLAIL
jgi:hypothetical protein